MYIRIKSVAELSIEELEELEKNTQIDGITVEGDRVSSNYSVEEYKQIYQKLLELTEGIDEEWSRTKKFALIYRRVSKNIEYDLIAAYPKEGNKEQEEYSRKEDDNCRNLKNGLLKGKCVCAGYAEILRNACLLKKVPVFEYDGIVGVEPHAWNIVEIENGIWIEVDPTWDHSEFYGTEYIGTNKKEFWKKHGMGSKGGKNAGIGKLLSIFYENYKISNFDLDAFINSEFGLDMKYTNKEQTIFIDLIDKRDAQGIDIGDELKSLIQLIESRIEFEQECGYTIEELKEYGFTDVEIEKMQASYDSNTGEKLNRKNIVKHKIDLKHKEEQEFEQECGYTIEELKEYGFTDVEIEKIQADRYDSRSGERINQKQRVRLKIKEINEINEKKITSLTKEDKESIQTKLEEFHPEIADLIISEIENATISIQDADIIIKHLEGNADEREIKSVIEKIKVQTEKLKAQDIIAKRKEFEQECGYTIEDLKAIGFTDVEIEKMQASYDINTGKKIDRKKVVEEAIAKKNQKNGEELFERECGYTIEDLKAMGFTDEEIEKLQVSHDVITGEENDRRKVVEEAIAKKFKKNREELFEKECGYTIEDLKAMGFTDEEIEKLQVSHDVITGEENDRRKNVEEAIKKKSKDSKQEGITLEEVGKGTKDSFSKNPDRANKTFEEFNKNVRDQQNGKDRPQGDE